MTPANRIRITKNLVATRAEAETTLGEIAARIREMIRRGEGEWVFRTRHVRCCFEFAVVRAASPHDALSKARALPLRERERRFVTAGEDPFTIEVLFEDEWWEIDDDAPADHEQEFAVAAARARRSESRHITGTPHPVV